MKDTAFFTNDNGEEVTPDVLYNIYVTITDLTSGMRDLCAILKKNGLYEDAGRARLIVCGLKEIDDQVYRLTPGTS